MQLFIFGYDRAQEKYLRAENENVAGITLEILSRHEGDMVLQI
jgi:hypothetical protein